MGPGDDQDENARAVGATNRQRDLDDFNNEIAGRETGRQRRFVPLGQGPDGERARRARDDEIDLFRNAAFALGLRLQQFSERVGELDRASLKALRAAEQRLRDSEERLADVRARAVRDDQGRLVYKTADGRQGFYDDGHEMSAEAIGRAHWRDDAPVWEERRKADDARERAAEDVDAIGAYRDRLHTARERLGSQTPISETELSELEADVGAMPDSVARELAPPGPPDESSLLGPRANLPAGKPGPR